MMSQSIVFAWFLKFTLIRNHSNVNPEVFSPHEENVRTRTTMHYIRNHPKWFGQKNYVQFQKITLTVSAKLFFPILTYSYTQFCTRDSKIRGTTTCKIPSSSFLSEAMLFFFASEADTWVWTSPFRKGSCSPHPSLSLRKSVNSLKDMAKTLWFCESAR